MQTNTPVLVVSIDNRGNTVLWKALPTVGQVIDHVRAFYANKNSTQLWEYARRTREVDLSTLLDSETGEIDCDKLAEFENSLLTMEAFFAALECSRQHGEAVKAFFTFEEAEFEFSRGLKNVSDAEFIDAIENCFGKN